MKKLYVYFFIISFLTSFVTLVYSAEEQKVDVVALFEQKCNICHSTERIKSKRKTKNEWESTVTRMKNVNRAPITDEEAKIIIDYLSKSYGK